MQTDRHDHQNVETDAKALESGKTLVELWLEKIKASQADEETWRKACITAINIFESDDEGTSFNILHANGQTLLPALYNSSPVPDVRRRFGDKGFIQKQVADVTERLISADLDSYDFDDEMRAVTRDSYVTGRGVARVVYRPHQDEEATWQDCYFERVQWDKFVRGPATSWTKMPWIAFEHDLTRSELVRLDETVGAKVPIGDEAGEFDTDSKGELDKGVYMTARVYEIWDRDTNKVLFVAERYKDKPLLEIDDPLGLPDFFPAIRPLQPVRRVSSLTPIVPYDTFKTLAAELNKITNRINALVAQCEVKGLTHPELTGAIHQLQDAEDGEFAQADASTLFAGPGGIEAMIHYWPLDKIIIVLRELYQQRDQIRAIIDQVSGVADIMRGNVDPREKLGQTQIKQNSGSIRITDWQNEIARLSKDIFKAKVALYAKHYTDETIQVKTSLPDEEDQEQMQAWPQVMQMFRSQILTFIIDIETDSTIRADMTRNQEQMNLFMQATAQFAQAMASVVPVAPGILPTVIEIYTAFARKFKLGKQAEDALDQLSSEAPKMNEQQDDPQAEAQKQQQESDQKRFEAELQLKQLDLEIKKIELQAKQMDAQAHAGKLEKESQAQAIQSDVEGQRQVIDLELKDRDLDLKARDLELKDLDLEIKRVELEARRNPPKQEAA